MPVAAMALSMTYKIGATQRYRGYVIMRGYGGYYVMRDGAHVGTVPTYSAAIQAIDGIHATMAAA